MILNALIWKIFSIFETLSLIVINDLPALLSFNFPSDVTFTTELSLDSIDVTNDVGSSS